MKVNQPTANPTRKWWYFAITGAIAGAAQGAVDGACTGGLALACTVPDVGPMVENLIPIVVGGLFAYMARERA